jgi:cytochrome c biogenesis protein CcmG, thiol:disulfide interchange protein DsbE
MKALRFLIPLAVFAALVLFLGKGLELNPREVPSPLIGKPAPAFTLPRLDDSKLSMKRDDLLGQAWVLNVWASWCVPCRAEHPLLIELARKKAAPIYGLNYKDKPEAALGFLKQLGDPFVATLVDADGRVGIDYGVYGVPETFVIDKAGVIRHKHIGPLTPEAVVRIEALLKQLAHG